MLLRIGGQGWHAPCRPQPDKKGTIPGITVAPARGMPSSAHVRCCCLCCMPALPGAGMPAALSPRHGCSVATHSLHAHTPSCDSQRQPPRNVKPCVASRRPAFPRPILLVLLLLLRPWSFGR